MSRNQKSLNTIDAIALTVGSMVGAGIFTVLALTVKTAGPAAIVSWVLVVVFSLPMAYCFSDLTGVLSQSGGPYVYIRDHTKHWMGMWVAWCFLVSAVGAAEALLMSLDGMFKQMGLPGGMWIGSVLLLMIAIVTSFGIHLGAMVQRVLTLGTVTLLLLCVGIGFGHIHGLQGFYWVHHSTSAGHAGDSASLLKSLAPNGWGAILPATFFAFWTYSGWEAVVVPSESYASPKSLSRGMMAGSLIVGVLYILVAAACVLSQPTASIANSFNPLVDVGRLMSPWAGQLVAWGAIVVVCGSLLSWLIASATLLQSVLRDGLFPAPRRLAAYPSAYHPSLPIFLAALLILGAQLPIFSQAISASSLTALIPYAVVFAVVALDPSANWNGIFKRRRHRRVVASIACAMAILLMVFSGWSNFWPTLVLLLMGICIVYIRRPKSQIQQQAKAVNES